MPNSNINYAMWLGSFCINPRTQVWESHPEIVAVDEDAPSNRARETIKDLKAGTVPQSIVRDLGDAVKQATRDGGVGRAIGQDRMVGGLSR